MNVPPSAALGFVGLSLSLLAVAVSGLRKASSRGFASPGDVRSVVEGSGCYRGTLRAVSGSLRTIAGEPAAVVQRTIAVRFVEDTDSPCRVFLEDVMRCEAVLEAEPAPVPPPESALPSPYRLDPSPPASSPPPPVRLDLSHVLPLVDRRQHSFAPDDFEASHPELWHRALRRLPSGIRVLRVDVFELALLDGATVLVSGEATLTGGRFSLASSPRRPLIVSSWSQAQTRRALRGPALELLAVALLSLLSCASLLALAHGPR